jgi:hypothetical protein
MPPSYPPTVSAPQSATPDGKQTGQPNDTPTEAPPTEPEAKPENYPWWSARRWTGSSGDPTAEDSEDQEETEDPPPEQAPKCRPQPDRIAAARVSWDTIPPKTKRLAYDLSATAAGWGIGMVGWDAALLASSHTAPTAYAATVLVLGTGSAAWLLSRPLSLPLRALGVTLATTVAYEGGEPTCRLLAAHGVDPTFAVPAVTAIGLVTAGWWISRRTRHWWPPLAWLLRAPFGCALVAAALYH